jgi:hypothetical protein
MPAWRPRVSTRYIGTTGDRARRGTERLAAARFMAARSGPVRVGKDPVSSPAPAAPRNPRKMFPLRLSGDEFAFRLNRQAEQY